MAAFSGRLQEFGLYNLYMFKIDLNDVDMLKQQPPQEKSCSKTNRKGGQALPRIVAFSIENRIHE